jgi:hypothetical protein
MRLRQAVENKLVAVIALAAVAAWLAAPGALAKATEDDLAKVQIGMSRDEVVQIMGRPDKEQEVKETELCRLFVYRSIGRYKIVNIWFDCNDKVKAVDKVGG